MTNHDTLAQRFYYLRRQRSDADWADVLDRAETKAEARPRRPVRATQLFGRRAPAKRRALAIILTVAAAAMGYAGVAFSLNRPSLPFTAPGPEDFETLRKAPGTEETIRPSPRVDGQTWDLRSYQNIRGELCVSHEVPGEAIGMGCTPPETLFKRGPLNARPRARQISAPYPKLEWDNQWVYGFAHPDIKTLTLVNMDCSTVALPLDGDGAFHHVVGRDEIRNGKQQYKLIARGTRGELLAERVVAIGLPRNAKNAGLEAPRPKASCR